MFGSTTLQTPKSGRSRFSKALPAPPSFPSQENGQGLMATSNPSHPANSYAHTHQPMYTYTPTQAQTQSQSQLQSQTQLTSPIRQFPASPTGLPFLKELPPIDLGPPLPPPKAFEQGMFDRETAMATVKPLNSPLPALPLKPGPPPAMSIPRRRPVGAPAPAPGPAQPQVQAQPQTPTVTLAPAPAPVPVPLPVLSPIPVLATAPSLAPSAAPDTAPEIISPNPLPSPVTSLSSLLSAYTDHSSESTPRTSTNSANNSPGTKDSYPGALPNPGGSRGTDSPTLPLAPDIHSSIKDDKSLPPPPPVKDSQPEPQKPQSQPRVGAQNVSPITDTSPTEQLWRRRSVKSDKNIAVPELKLTSSNGSTVASGHISISSQGAPSGMGGLNSVPLSSQVYDQPDSSAVPPKVRVPLPRSINAGLPGKNIRPVPSRQQIKEDENMGQSASKLNNSGQQPWGKAKENRQGGKTEDASSNQHEPATTAPSKSLPNTTAHPNIGRLPTPDYESNEARNALSAKVLSPVSPASSPELPVDTTSVVSPISPGGAVDNRDRAPEYKPGLQTLNIPRQPVGLPSSPGANRSQSRPGNTNFPARTSSKAKSQRDDGESGKRTMEVPPSLRVGRQQELPLQTANLAASNPTTQAGPAEPEKAPKTESPEIGVSLNSSLPGQQTAEDENLTDNPGAALFPRDWTSPLPADGVLDALPITDRHLQCITNHRYMTANRQRCNPIACATCGQRDRNSDAYICSSCHLNICASCSANLRRFRGDLYQLVDQIFERRAAIKDEERTATITQANNSGEGQQTGA